MTDQTYSDILNYFRDITSGTEWEGHLFAVGGCVRDEILGSEIKDVDIAVDLPNGGIEFAKWLRKKRLLAGMPILFLKFGTAKLRLRRFPEEEIELVQTRAEKYTKKTSRCPEVVSGTLQEDCFRRDFTVNTLYRNISTGEILDMTGRGIADIKRGIIRTPMNPDETFDDDPVRVLRCLRFAARFGWEIDPDTMAGLKKNVDRLGIVSRERWSAEFQKMLFGRNVRRSLGTLNELGGLAYMDPHLMEMSKKRVGTERKSLLDRGVEAVAELEDKGIDNPALRLEAFFSEIGKLRTAVTDEKGGVRYPKHGFTGSFMAAKLLRHFGVAEQTVEDVKLLMQARGEEREAREKLEKAEARRLQLEHRILTREQDAMHRTERKAEEETPDKHKKVRKPASHSRGRKASRARSSARAQSAGVSRSTDLEEGMK